MQVMLMRLMSKGEYLIVPKGTKFTGSGKLGLKFISPPSLGKQCYRKMFGKIRIKHKGILQGYKQTTNTFFHYSKEATSSDRVLHPSGYPPPT